MKAKIISIHSHGDFDKEYVLIQVLEDCDIGKFLVADSTYTSDSQISNKLRHTYWFPDRATEKGDLVSLWTKPGTNTTDKNSSGTTVHRFFWGLKTAVWNNEGDCAVLQEIRDWQHYKAKK